MQNADRSYEIFVLKSENISRASQTAERNSADLPFTNWYLIINKIYINSENALKEYESPNYI